MRCVACGSNTCGNDTASGVCFETWLAEDDFFGDAEDESRTRNEFGVNGRGQMLYENGCSDGAFGQTGEHFGVNNQQRAEEDCLALHSNGETVESEFWSAVR